MSIQTIDKLYGEAAAAISKARLSLSKMNSCHNQSDGKFCASGGSGGGGAGSAHRPEYKSRAKAADKATAIAGKATAAATKAEGTPQEKYAKNKTAMIENTRAADAHLRAALRAEEGSATQNHHFSARTKHETLAERFNSKLLGQLFR